MNRAATGWPSEAIIALAEGRHAVLVKQLTAIAHDKQLAVKILLRGMLHRENDTDDDAFEEPRRVRT